VVAAADCPSLQYILAVIFTGPCNEELAVVPPWWHGHHKAGEQRVAERGAGEKLVWNRGPGTNKTERAASMHGTAKAQSEFACIALAACTGRQYAEGNTVSQ